MPKVLVVHHDETSRFNLVTAFTQLGYETHAPNSFGEVIDICLRGANGYEVIAMVSPYQFNGYLVNSYLELINKVDRNIPIVDLEFTVWSRLALENMGFEVLNEGKVDCSEVDWVKEILSHVTSQIKSEVLI